MDKKSDDYMPHPETEKAAVFEAERIIQEHAAKTPKLTKIERDISEIQERDRQRIELQARRDALIDESDEWSNYSEQEQSFLQEIVPLINRRLSYDQENPGFVPAEVIRTHDRDTSDTYRYVVVEGPNEEGSRLSVALFAENCRTNHMNGNDFSNVWLKWIDRNTPRQGGLRFENTPHGNKRIFMFEEDPDLTRLFYEDDLRRWDNGHATDTKHSVEKEFKEPKFKRLSAEMHGSIITALEFGVPNSDFMSRESVFLNGYLGKKSQAPTKLPLGASFRLPGGLSIDV